jgi:hypothetical protein
MLAGAVALAALPALAGQARIEAGQPVAGATPFIAFVPLEGVAVDRLSSVRFTIEPAPGSASRPVSVQYAMSWLARRGYVDGGNQKLTLPVFGLYDGTPNTVTLSLQFADGSTSALPVIVATSSYVDPSGIYDRPQVVRRRPAGAPLGFDFFYLKSLIGSPVVVDTDGRIRWVAAGVEGTYSSTFTDGAFVLGLPHSLDIARVELDGGVTVPAQLATPDGSNFSHSVDAGRQGLMGEIDADIDGRAVLRSIANEFDPATGREYREWNIDQIIADHMSSHGDDPARFVRPDTDWFHMNMVFYDARDDSVIVSSRENFVMKIDHATGAIKWIFGDPTKYWYTFPSLRALSLELAPGGLQPLGQHAVTIAPDGRLLLFNNGTPSFHQPAGEPAGAKRAYSAVSSYAIDEARRTVTQQWVFDYGQTLRSSLCGSARQVSDGSVLVDYAIAADGTQTRIVGLDADHAVVFDLQYENRSGCSTAWNAQPIAFDDLFLQ